MANPAPLRPFSVAKTVHGNSPWEQQFPEGASQTFKTGAVVQLDSNGFVIECTSPNPITILGVAAGDAHNSTPGGTDNILVWIADDETIFRGNVVGNTADSAAVTTLVDVGRGYGILKSTTAAGGDTWEINKTNVTNRCVVVVDLDPQDAVGATNGRLLFMFFSTVRQLDYTS